MIRRIRKISMAKMERRGVASTVGTMFAIIIILTIFSTITTFWVPAWMKDREADHNQEVLEQFARLKATVELQILQSNIDIVMHTPVSLGIPGVPMLASTSKGTLSISTTSSYFNVKNGTCDWSSGDMTGTVIVSASGGSVEYASNNIEYVDQTLSYENGAIVLDQPPYGQVVLFGPQFSVDNSTGNVTVMVVVNSLLGESKSTSGSSTRSVCTKLLYVSGEGKNVKKFTPTQFVELNFSTAYPEAWVEYFNKSLSKEFSPSVYTDVKVGDVRTLTGGSNYKIISDLSSVRVIISGVAQVSIVDVILEVTLE